MCWLAMVESFLSGTLKSQRTKDSKNKTKQKQKHARFKTTGLVMGGES